jgi:hypothetical protein
LFELQVKLSTAYDTTVCCLDQRDERSNRNHVYVLGEHPQACSRPGSTTRNQAHFVLEAGSSDQLWVAKTELGQVERAGRRHRWIQADGGRDRGASRKGSSLARRQSSKTELILLCHTVQLGEAIDNLTGLLNSPDIPPSTSMMHAASRHRDVLDDYRRDFVRTRVSPKGWAREGSVKLIPTRLFI